MTAVPRPWSAIVLSGGRGERLGGVEKAAVEFEGRTLLAHALEAVAGAAEVVVVGDTAPTERAVIFTREEPEYGGPVAGLLAGLDALTRPAAYVVVLAVDMPQVTAATLARLRAAVGERDGAILTDPDGRRQLAFVARTDRLRVALPAGEERHGLPLRRLLAPLDLIDVAGLGREHRDVDTWADLRELG